MGIREVANKTPIRCLHLQETNDMGASIELMTWIRHFYGLLNFLITEKDRFTQSIEVAYAWRGV